MKNRLLILLVTLQMTLSAFDQTILPVEKAFVPTVTSDGETIKTEIKLAQQIYVYDEQLQYKIISPKEIDLRPLLSVPKPVEFHEFIVHRDDIVVDIPLQLIQKELGKEPFKLQLFYQGCSEKGLCYQPMNPIYSFDAKGTW